MARAARAEAVRRLKQALEMTSFRDVIWREAIAEHLQRAESGELPSSYAAQQPGYAHGQELLRLAEDETADWRALMHFGKPEVATLTLLVLFAAVYLAGNLSLHGSLQEKFWLWAGNSAATIKQHEWWRAFTALFLHANLLHLAMNGTGLWLFGSVVEKTVGRWRFLLIFLLGGALGNLASASMARYDIAVGASGGIFSVIGAFAVAVWRLQSPIYHTLRRRLLLFLLLMVSVDLSIGWLEPRIDNVAHVGGFLAGILLAMMLFPKRNPS